MKMRVFYTFARFWRHSGGIWARFSAVLGNILGGIWADIVGGIRVGTLGILGGIRADIVGWYLNVLVGIWGRYLAVNGRHLGAEFFCRPAFFVTYVIHAVYVDRYLLV